MANVRTQLPPIRPAETVEEQFHRLADAWQSAVAHLSSSTKRDHHPAYQAIIALGPPVVPFLLADLERSQRHWFTALSAITGADPVAPQAAGIIQRMADAWVAWGKKQGIQW
jgi:hypothetical protein